MAKSRLTAKRFLIKVHFLNGKAKNAASCASAGSPSDFVSDAGFVRVPQNFINGNKVKSIDFGVDYQAVRAAEGH